MLLAAFAEFCELTTGRVPSIKIFMKTVKSTIAGIINRFWLDENAQSEIEYVIMVFLIVAVSVIVLTVVDGKDTKVFSTTAGK